jgi:hypothetical protein
MSDLIRPSEVLPAVPIPSDSGLRISLSALAGSIAGGVVGAALDTICQVKVARHYYSLLDTAQKQAMAYAVNGMLQPVLRDEAEGRMDPDIAKWYKGQCMKTLDKIR